MTTMKEERSVSEVLQLPQSKTPPSLSPQGMKALLYGPPKVGKSSFCADLDPDHTLFLATEPGLDGLEVFKEPVSDWAKFRSVFQALATTEHDFTTIVVDTVDMLFLYCRNAAMEELGATHPSDLEWGKGWDAVATKFRTGLGSLASLGLGVWLVSHSEDVEIKQRVGTITKTVPALSGQGRKFVTGFVDYIFFAHVMQTEDGPRHVLRTAAQEGFEAGGRIGPPKYQRLPDPLPLEAGALLDAVARATKQEEKHAAHDVPGEPVSRRVPTAPGANAPPAPNVGRRTANADAQHGLKPAAASRVPAAANESA